MKRNPALAVVLCLSALCGGASYAASEPSPAAPQKKSVADSTWIRASAKHTDFVVFTESGQAAAGVLSAAGGKAQVRGTAGTVVSTDSAQPILHNGCLRVDCERGNVTIGTRVFAATVPAGASAIIESLPAIKVFRVVALSAPGNEHVTVRFKASRLPARLVTGEMVSGEGSEKPYATVKFNSTTFLAESPESAPLIQNTGVVSAPSKIKAVRGAEFKCMSSGVVSIREGECFIQCGSPLAVSGPTGQALAKKGSMVDVEAYFGEFRVKSLSGPGHTTVMSAGQSLTLHPGQEMFLSRHVVEDSDLTPPDGVGRRRFDQHTLTDGTKVVVSDFSILSFLGAAEHMQALRHSQAGDDHAVSERILKTAAAVQSLTAASGPYKATAKSTRKRNPNRETGPSA